MRGKRILLHDMCLRDGMHSLRHRIPIDRMVAVATGLEEAGVPLIEVTHGDGLGGSSVTFGFAAHSDEDYLRAVVPRMKRARISALLLPGIGTVEDLRRAHDCGISTLRIATHCTEADVADQHISVSRKLGLDTVGFLMMAHMLDPDALVEQAKRMEAAGANCIYCTDSAGHMLPQDVSARVRALREALAPGTEIGFHGHHNMAMGVANSIAAVTAGADRIDGSAAGLGAGAGNTPLEVFNAVCARLGIETGVSVLGLMNVAEEIVLPMMEEPVRIDRDALILGYAGVYSSFLLFAKRAAQRYGVSSADILVEIGRLRAVGGQEDLIEDVAITLSRSRSGSEHGRSSSQ